MTELIDQEIDAVFHHYASANDNGVAYLRTYEAGFRRIARAIIEKDRAQRLAGQQAACWIDANDLKQMQDKGRGSIVWKRPQDGYEQTALYTAPQAAVAPTSRDEGLARIRGLIALDRCDGETEYAAGANAARDKYLAIIDAAKS